jgi:serine/threonine protein kinase, bacterial
VAVLPVVKRLAAYGEPVEGTSFGRYRLIELLGRGGMGEVWRAHDTATNNRTVAIKLLPAQLAADPTFVARFRREADAAAQLNNPHIIPIHTYGEIDGRLYVDMRLVEGRDLHGVLADGPLAPARAVRVIEQVAKALHAAHKIGLVHRDVKPSNILLDEDDFAYLIDFGIARAASDAPLTSSGGVIGSWHYMSPERMQAGQVDARADIYALACVLYECLTGSTPFPGNNTEQQITAHLTAPPPRPSITDPDVPATFDPVIAKGMAKDPDQRYASTVELARAAHAAITTPLPLPGKPTRLRDALRGSRPDDQPPPAPAPVRQQAGDLDPGAIPQRPPGQPPTPRLRPTADRSSPQVDTPPAPPKRRRQKWPLIAGIVVILAAAGVGGYLWRPHSPASSTPSAQSAAPPGQTAQPASASGQTVLPLAGLSGPGGVAVDSVGDVYVADAGNNRVLELAAGSGSPTALPFSGLGNPRGVAVDGTRAAYVTNVGNSRVLKLAAGSSGTTELPFTGLSNPSGVAVDTAGAVYVTAGGNRVLKLPAGSSGSIVLPFTGLSNPSGVAVDASGAVYVVDTGNNRVLKLAAGSGTPTALSFTGLNNPSDVAVDKAGNLYVADTGNNRVVKLAGG